jgi:hypothetical protein
MYYGNANTDAENQCLFMNRNAAEILAVEALTFLASDSERLGRFLALTGISPAEIRSVARDPAFLVAVLDHLASDEKLLIAFADQAGRRASEVMQARAVIGGRPWEGDTS